MVRDEEGSPRGDLMHQINYKRIVLYLTLTLALVSIGFSLFGGWRAGVAAGHVDWLDIVYHTYKFFKLDDRPPPNIWLAWARVLAPLATFSVLIQIVLEYFGGHITRWSNRNLRDHIVVYGLGTKGTAFIENLRKGPDRKRAIIAIERDPSDAQINFCRHQGVRLVRADGALEATHFDAASHHAACALVLTGSDDRNLRIATHLCETTAGRSAGNPLRVFASIGDTGLWNELSNSSAVRRLWDNAELIPFSLPLLAARKFFWDHALYSYADIRGQTRIHVVFAGFGQYAASLLLHLLRACVYKDFAPPLVTVLMSGADRARARFARRFGELLKDEPGLGVVLDIRFFEFDFEKDALDGPHMATMAQDGDVSAVIIDQDTPEATLAVTLRVREAMGLADRWRAPIFVRSDASGLSARIFAGEASTARFDEVIVPFGGNAVLCDVGVIEGEMEQLARRIHTRYQDTRAGLMEQDAAGARAASARDWAALPETYRQANRRAADHVKAKLASAGLYMPPGFALKAPQSVRLSDEMIERLARLEHVTWAIERRIDGWVPNPWRDDARKLHDNLVGYDDLSDAVKNYDCDQIHLIDAHVLERVAAKNSDASLVREDHWVGLIGANLIDASVADWIDQTLREDVLPRVLARTPDALITLVSPLAPGSDAVQTRTALSFLSGKAQVHRLIVPEGVPAEPMLADYDRAKSAGLVTGFEAGDGDLRAGRRMFLRGTDEADMRLSGWHVDLTDPAQDYRGDQAAREAGYAKAGAYIARKCQTLIAVADLSAVRRPGGTLDTLCLRHGLDAAPSGWPLPDPRTTIVLDPKTRSVVHEPAQLAACLQVVNA